MKTKRKKTKKEAKRKKLCAESKSGPSTYRATALPLAHVEHTGFGRNFIIKTFKPYYREFFSEERLQFRQGKPNVDALHRIYM